MRNQSSSTREGAYTRSEALGDAPLGRLMLVLAVPSIAAQLANVLYNTIDRMFLGHVEGIGSDALAGLGVCLPIIMLVSSFGVLIAAGGAPLASMDLGKGDCDRAQQDVLHVETLLLYCAAASMVAAYAFMHPLLTAFGASDTTLPYAVTYLSIYLIGTVFVMATVGLSMLLLAQGNSVAMLVAEVAGAVLHIGLGALFIFYFGWGVVGAAVASVVSQGASAGLIVYFLTRPTSVLHFEFRLVKLEWPLVRRMLSIGSGRFFILASEAILLVVLNRTMQAYGGDAYVGVITVLYSLENLIFAVIQGFTQSVQPIVSYCYGARKLARARAATKRIIALSFFVDFGLTLPVIAFPEACAALFASDASLVSLVADNARPFFLGVAFFGAQLGMQTIFMALGKGLCSLTVAFVRKMVLFIPLVLVLPHFFGVSGVVWAEPVSDFLSIAFCTTLFLKVVPRELAEPTGADES